MKKIASKGHAFGPTALTADTKTTIGSAYKVPKGGTIKLIRFCFYQGVIDKATTGILYLESNVQKGPFEYAVGGSIGITTTSGATGPNIATEEIKVNIPVDPEEEITMSAKMAESLEEGTVSIHWE